MVLRGRWFKIIVLYVQAPSEEKNDSKDSFYDEFRVGCKVHFKTVPE